MAVKYLITYKNRFTMHMKLRMAPKLNWKWNTLLEKSSSNTLEFEVRQIRVYPQEHDQPICHLPKFNTGCTEPTFLRLHVLSNCPCILIVSVLRRLIKQAPFIHSWFPLRFIPSFDFCILRKTAFTGIYLRIAVVILFQLCAVLFRLTASGEGWRSSGLYDMLNGGFGSAHAFLAGSGSE